MGELLYNIEKVFSEVLKEHNAQAYNIPSYQRGYKWTSKEVEQLLKDIDHFEMAAGDDLFYCLQNITLTKNDKVLNVIDGQQRLTTIYILLCYLVVPSLWIPIFDEEKVVSFHFESDSDEEVINQIKSLIKDQS